MITHFHQHSLQYVNEADLIRYAWFGSWADDERRCAFRLIELGNFRYLAFKSSFLN